MTGVDALITVGLFAVVSGIAGVACWLIEVWARWTQADWQGEANSRGVR